MFENSPTKLAEQSVSTTSRFAARNDSRITQVLSRVIEVGVRMTISAENSNSRLPLAEVAQSKQNENTVASRSRVDYCYYHPKKAK